MKKAVLATLLSGLLIFTLNAKDNNSTQENNGTTKDKITEKHLQEQIEREKKYAKEQTFYQGDDYNLSSAKVNPASLSSISVIEPDYDFNMDDTYSDEQ